jgi:hypothetical protein
MVLTAYTEESYMDEQLLQAFETAFENKYEEMQPVDTATFYYYFTKLGFKGDGIFYKFLQKCLTKTIG